MIDRLFVLLLSLTMLDLAFVHATDVVPAVELLPLWSLTAAAFWLRRLQRFRCYRWAWNVGVVLVFALLVHHATTSGLLHMLEDGLVLAVLCQVHLLNNVGERQRPDLVFFNSFLIAFVTSFFAPDVLWSALFVTHAFVLVPSLQMHSLARTTGNPHPALVRAVWRDCVGRTTAVVALAALAFVVLPRDFRREGWLGGALALGQQFETGLAERIRIDDEHKTRLPENIVARIVPASGQQDDVPAHWRATAFSTFDGTGWAPQDARVLGTRFATDPSWERRPDGSLQRALPPGARGRVTLQLLDVDSSRLLLPLGADLVVPGQGQRAQWNPRSDGTIRLLDAGNTKRIDCAIAFAATSGTVPITARTRAHMTALPDDVPDAVYDLATQLRGNSRQEGGSLAIANACSTWLQHNRRYQLPGQPGFARNLGEFLLGSGAGHCEYFATALALLLRVQDVPCRLVGGYLAQEWDAATRSIVLRGKHAHAWVEVLAEDGSWHTLDPTPAADGHADAAAGDGWWAALRAELEAWWAAVTGFDQNARRRWLAALAALPADHPFQLAGVAAAMLGLWLLRRRGRQALPSIVALHRSLRAAGLSLQPGETPRELLARAARAGLDPEVLARLGHAARQHEAQRYGAPAAGPATGPSCQPASRCGA